MICSFFVCDFFDTKNGFLENTTTKSKELGRRERRGRWQEIILFAAMMEVKKWCLRNLLEEDDDDEDTISIVLWSFCEVEEIDFTMDGILCNFRREKKRGQILWLFLEIWWRRRRWLVWGLGGDQFVRKVHRIHMWRCGDKWGPCYKCHMIHLQTRMYQNINQFEKL